MKSKLLPSGHQFVVCHPNCPDRVTLDLLGGYGSEDGSHTVILFRYVAPSTDEEKDGAFLLFGRTQVFMVPENIALCVESGDWNRFAAMPVGSRFKLDGRMWIKMAVRDLKAKFRSPLRALGPVIKP